MRSFCLRERCPRKCPFKGNEHGCFQVQIFARENWLNSNIHEFAIHEDVRCSFGILCIGVHIKMSLQHFFGSVFRRLSTLTVRFSSKTIAIVFVHVKRTRILILTLFFVSLCFIFCLLLLLLSIERFKMVYTIHTKCKLHAPNKTTTEKSGCQVHREIGRW